MAIKKTLLQIVQGILNDLDSEDVNSLSDTLEAQQVASIVEDTFYNLIAAREIPEHQELLKATALSDSSTPTHFKMENNIRGIEKVWYDISETSETEYVEIDKVDPLKFLQRQDGLASNYDTVTDLNGGTTYRVANDSPPTCFTSFDDEYIVFDAYDSDVEATLQQSKIRCWGTVYPVFNASDDDYVPDIDSVMFPYLIAEAKSTSFDILKGGISQKVEQAARRQKTYIQNDKYRTEQNRRWSSYGRR